MEQWRKRLGFLALVGGVLLIAVLASLTSATWATPEQIPRMNDDTIPDKYCDDTMVWRGQSTEIEIVVHNPSTASDTWTSTLVTDTVDSNLKITGLGTTQGTAGWTGQEVTFTIGTVAPGSTVNLSIYVETRMDASEGHEVYNTAYMSHTGWGPVSSDSAWMFKIGYRQDHPLGMKRYR